MSRPRSSCDKIARVTREHPGVALVLPLRWVPPAVVLFVLVLGLAGGSARAAPAPLTPGAGWKAYGGAYGPPTVEQVGDTITLSGLVTPTDAAAWSKPVATLPEAMRPSSRRVLHANRHTAGARIDVHPDGTVRFVAGGTVSWVSLSGLSFSVKTPTRLSYAAGWSDYGSGYAPGGFSEEDGVIRLSGMMKGATGSPSTIATLPAGKRPAARHIFRVNQHERIGGASLHRSEQRLAQARAPPIPEQASG